MYNTAMKHIPALCVLPAVMGVGLWWRGRKLGHRALMGHQAGQNSRGVWFCRCLVGLGGCGVGMGLRTVLLRHGALLLRGGG